MQRSISEEVPEADVVVTNPAHLAVALRYDRETMKSPKIVAKGARYNALMIREIAEKNGVPLVENKPLAQMLFKFGRVGKEIHEPRSVPSRLLAECLHVKPQVSIAEGEVG